MSQPQQPKAAPTPTNTIDNKVDEIEFYIGELIVDILEDVGEVFAPKQPDGSPERKKLLGLVGDIQPYRERATQAIHAAINKTIMEARLDELLKTVITLEGFMNGTSSYPAADGILEIKDRIAELKKYGRADNEKV